jgi:hypothetical protein
VRLGEPVKVWKQGLSAKSEEVTPGRIKGFCELARNENQSRPWNVSGVADVDFAFAGPHRAPGLVDDRAED